MTSVEDQQNKTIDDLLDRATKALRCVSVPPGPRPEAVARVLDAVSESSVAPRSIKKRSGRFDRFAKVAIAASALAAVAILAVWLLIGNSSNMAFAAVADVLEHLHSATFDMFVEMSGDPTVRATAKGLYMAPSFQRIEASEKAKTFSEMVIIADYSTARGIVLLPKQKVAVIVDSERIKDQIDNPMACMLDTMRCLVREGRNRVGAKVESVGTKEIDGHAVVGFFVRSSMADMTLWADSTTARPVRIELDMPGVKARGVLSNFRYDVGLDPSLFKIESPPGYLTQTIDVTMPMEEGLIQTLRAIAEQRNGMFPNKLGMNKEVMDALQSLAKPDILDIAVADEDQALDAIMGTLPLEQKYLQGILFYMSLKPQNRAEYLGKDVKLGTPNRPIFWYKPTGAKNYHVIYADLTVKEMAADEVKKLRPAKAK
jgi:hypothetical protein